MKNKPSYKEKVFFNRLLEILKSEKQNWWAEHTDTSQSMVSNYWFKGKHPRGDKIGKILALKQISANWLYYGIGPKSLGDLDEAEIERKQNIDRQTQIKIMELTEENIRLQEKLDQSDIELGQKKFLSDIDEPLTDQGTDVSKDQIIGALSTARTIMDIILKLAEQYSRQNVDSEKFRMIIDWMVQHKESKRYSTAAMLRDLENIIK